MTAVWWEGHWVNPDQLRAALIAPLERLRDEVRAARAGEENPYQAADLVMAGMNDESKPSQAVALIRRRLTGRADFPNLLWTLLSIGLGGDAPWEHEDRSRPDPAPSALQLLVTAFGVDRAMSDDPVGNGPWLPTDFDMAQFMGELIDAGGFDLGDPARPIREATLEQLERAREDAALLSRPLATIGKVLEELLGEDVGGMGSLSVFAAGASSARAELVRSVVILRSLAGDTAFEAIKQLVEREHAKYEAISELRAGLPQHAEVLGVDCEERLAALPAGDAEIVLADVAGFLETHPHVPRALSEQPTPTSAPAGANELAAS